MQRRFIDPLSIIRRAALNQNHQLIFNDLVLAARLRTPRRCWSVHKINFKTYGDIRAGIRSSPVKPSFHCHHLNI